MMQPTAGPKKPNPPARPDPDRPKRPATDPERRDRPTDPEPDGPMPDALE